MLEHMKKPLIDAQQVFLGVICEQAILAEVRASLEAKGCIIRNEEPAVSSEKNKEWFDLEEVFPDHHGGDAICGLRYRENLTQKQLAEQVGISVQNLSHMEHGRRSIGKEMAKRLANVLNADWRVFI